ncbi:MAG: hypothetical protein H6839_15370 [Planctomycetes bacterium]|nr:hypothetical protein [Planctomycetota bacterium]
MLAALAAGALRAQSVGSPVTGTFNTNDWHTVRIDVDYGSTPQAITAGVDVISLSGPTFLFEWIDWDAYVLNQGSHISVQQVMPGANNTAQWTTPARTGVHPLVLRLENTIDPAMVVDYAFSMTLSGGNVLGYTQTDRPWVTSGFPVRSLEADIAATFINWGVANNTGTFVTLDFGPTPQSADVRLECSAQGVNDIVMRWPDGMGGRGALFVDSDPGGNIYSVPGVPHLVTIPAQTGLAEVTIGISPQAGFVYADWNLCVSGNVRVVGMRAPAKQKDTGGVSGEQQGCTSGAGGSLPATLAAVAGWALARRRRRMN